MDTNVIDRLRIESRLSESFCIAATNDGKRIVAMNGYVVDYPTFCTMLIWYLSDTMGYSRILQERNGLVTFLKHANEWDGHLSKLNGYHVMNHIYNSMFIPLRGQDKKEVGARLLSMLGDI